MRVYRAGRRTDSIARTSSGIDTVTVDTVSIWSSMDADLATIDVVDGVVRRLVRRVPLFWYDPSPDGRWKSPAPTASR